MHILFVTGTYYPSTNGVAIAVSGYKKELEKRGHEVTVLAPQYPGFDEIESGVIRYPSINKPGLIDYPVPLLPGIRTIYKLLGRKRPDIIHVHHPFLIGYFAKLLSLHYKSPLVFTYHTNYDVHTEEYLKFVPSDLKKEFVGNRVHEFCEKVDLVVAPSEFIKKRVKDNNPKVPVRVIPTPVFDLGSSKLSKNEARKKLHLPANKKLLLTVSRVAPEKNMGALIGAMNYLPKDFCLVVVGDGRSKAGLKVRARKLGVADRVFFVGKIPHAEVHVYYKACDVFFFASQTETQGLIFFEALFVGLPIIAADSEAAREFVSKKSGIIVKPNPEDLARSVKAFFDGKDSEKLWIKKAAFPSKFSKSVLVAKLLKSYQELLEQ